jgi:hypothetical protein
MLAVNFYCYYVKSVYRHEFHGIVRQGAHLNLVAIKRSTYINEV